ncbi:MAG TPA: VC0807 family protein [Streptosporangiaceae bacterium]|jgi:hypothetical protein
MAPSSTPSAAVPAAPPARPRGKPLDYAINWTPTIIFTIVLPYLTYGQLTDRHIMGEVPALLLAGAWPLLESLAMLAIRRKVDELGMLVLIGMLATAVSMVAFNSPSMLLVKDSGVTGLVGLAFLVSLALPRPLMFYFGRKFATNGSKAAVAYWNGLWQFGGFRHTQRVLTVIWGLGFLAEAVLRIIVVLSGVLPIKTLVLVSSIFPYVVLCALMAFTFGYSMRSQRKSAAAMAATAELNRLSQAR